MSEQVNHPSHYNQEGRMECIDEMVLFFGEGFVCSWCILTAYKYLYRAGNKDSNPKEQDIAKAKWYLDWAKSHSYSIYGLEDKYNKVANAMLEIITA